MATLLILGVGVAIILYCVLGILVVIADCIWDFIP